jgi:hypothetical protein
MAGRGEGPEFIEALAGGLDVIRVFGRERPRLTLGRRAGPGRRRRGPGGDERDRALG